LFVLTYFDTFFINYPGKEGNKLFKKPMKMKDLEVWGVPSYIVDIWEKNYSPHLMSVQEKAVRYYGVLDYKKRRRLDKNQNLLVIAPTSSGKTFIGEMAAVTQAIHNKRTIYLVPLRTLAEEKYRRFKKMYHACGIDVAISSRDRKEDDIRIGSGRFEIAIMVYEKFHYFLLKHPAFLSRVSLVIIDEMQVINDPMRGPLLEEILVGLQKQEQKMKVIALSAFLENQRGFLAWFPCRVLTSYLRPVELRKGIVRNGIFKYITHNEKKVGEEVFFNPITVRDNCREDYLLETVRYFAENNEPTLLFFPTRAECKRWAQWLADKLEDCPAEKAIEDLQHMEETLTRDNLLPLLEKGIAYHNSDLSWEERNLVENYLQNGEIKIICATTTLAMGVNLPFKNVILSIDKVESVNGDYQDVRLTSLTFSDIENMGGRAGRLNSGKKEEFGRVIFLAHSLLSETIYQNLYFNFLRDRLEKNDAEDYIGERQDKGKAAEEMIPYPEIDDWDNDGLDGAVGPKKKEKDLTTLLLRLIVNGKDTIDAILASINEGSLTGGKTGASDVSLLEENRGYWQFVIDKKRSKEKIDDSLIQLQEKSLITKDDKGRFSATDAGLLIIAKGISVNTYFYFLSWLGGSIKGEISPLEIIFTLTLSEDGKALPIPYPQFYRKGYQKGKYHYTDWQEVYRNKLLSLVFDLGEEGKEIYQGEHGLQKGKTGIEDYLAFKKTLLLYDWIGSREIRSIEQEYSLYHGAVKRLGEGFSWLADSLAAVAEDADWKKEREADLNKIRNLSEQLVEGVEEQGLSLAQLHIPGLTRSYIERLVKEGYEDEDCLEEVGEKELGDILPGRLVRRIQERIKEKKVEEKEEEIRKEKEKEGEAAGGEIGREEEQEVEEEKQGPGAKKEKEKREVKVDNEMEMIVPVLEIDQHRPDRIIFEGKEIKVTAIEFSLIYLLAQHRRTILTHNDLLDTIWKEDEDATYVQITYHLYRIRRDILKIIGNNKKNKERIKDILKVISRRGIMLNLEEDKLKIN